HRLAHEPQKELVVERVGARERRARDRPHEVAGIDRRVIERAGEQRAQTRVERMAEVEETDEVAELSPQCVGAGVALEREHDLLERAACISLAAHHRRGAPSLLAHGGSISAKIVGVKPSTVFLSLPWRWRPP